MLLHAEYEQLMHRIYYTDSCEFPISHDQGNGVQVVILIFCIPKHFLLLLEVFIYTNYTMPLLLNARERTYQCMNNSHSLNYVSAAQQSFCLDMFLQTFLFTQS